jgi:hypothetical protein
VRVAGSEILLLVMGISFWTMLGRVPFSASQLVEPLREKQSLNKPDGGDFELLLEKNTCTLFFAVPSEKA